MLFFKKKRLTYNYSTQNAELKNCNDTIGFKLGIISSKRNLLECSFWNFPDDVVSERELLQTLDGPEDIVAEGADPVVVGLQSFQVGQAAEGSGRK